MESAVSKVNSCHWVSQGLIKDITEAEVSLYMLLLWLILWDVLHAGHRNDASFCQFVWFWFGLVWLTYLSYVDKRHTKFVVSLPLNAAQGSHSAAPMGRGKQAWGTLPKVPMPKHPPVLDDHRMRWVMIRNPRNGWTQPYHFTTHYENPDIAKNDSWHWSYTYQMQRDEENE